MAELSETIPEFTLAVKGNKGKKVRVSISGIISLDNLLSFRSESESFLSRMTPASLAVDLGGLEYVDSAGALALLRPAVGFAVAWLVAGLLELPGQQASLLMLFGALPPAVMNFIFAERYGQEPERVASIVLIGNLAAVLVLPVAMGAVLG